MSVSGILGWLNIRGLSVVPQFPAEIYDGQQTYVTLQLENRKKFLPSFLIRVALAGGTADFHLLDRRSVTTETVAIVLAGRGWHELTQVAVISRFPINFFVRSTILPLQERCLVFPRPRRCRLLSVAEGGNARGTSLGRGRGMEGEVENIAEYSGREPLKKIHWRLSARHDTLKVKELSAVVDEPVVLDLNSLTGESLEEVLGCYAWLVNRYIRAQRPVGMIVGRKVLSPDTSALHRLKMLSELALYGKR